jgi:hypothetical protein
MGATEYEKLESCMMRSAVPKWVLAKVKGGRRSIQPKLYSLDGIINSMAMRFIGCT